MPMSSDRKRLGWVVAITAAVIGIGFLFLRSDTGQLLTGRWSFVKSVYQDHGTYFRLKVKLTYWGTPQDFDIVVGCNVRQINYKDGSNTYEVGLVPTVFGRRMYDGKGLVVRPPDACKGQTTANHMVAPDFLPLLVVYDNADTLDFGVAYLSDDAYENPLSVLRFSSATVEKATRAEFDAFRAAQPNLVARESYWSALAGEAVLKQMKLSRLARPFAHSCEGYRRFRIPEELRASVREQWPEGHPHYWQIMAGHTLGEFDFSITHRTLIQSDGKDDLPRPFSSFPALTNMTDIGFPRRNGSGLISLYPSQRNMSFASAFYPMSADFRVDKGPPDPKEWPAYLASLDRIATANVDFRSGLTKGFGYCYAFRNRADGEVMSDDDARKLIASKRIVGKVDGEDIVSQDMFSSPWYKPTWFFEDDEYGFRFFQFYLESTRGDV